MIVSSFGDIVAIVVMVISFSFLLFCIHELTRRRRQRV